MTQGQVIVFDESLPIDERVDAVLSSTTIPFVFPPIQNLADMYLVDGGMFNTVSVGDPIERCREEVESDRDIIIDVLLCYTQVYEVPEWDHHKTRWMTAFDFYRRRKVISNYYFYKEDFLRMTRGYHDVQFRLVI